MDPLPILVLTALCLHNSFSLPILVLTALWLYSPLPLRILFLLIFWLFSRSRNQNLSTTTSQRAVTCADSGLDTTGEGATPTPDIPDTGSDTTSKRATPSPDNSGTGSDTAIKRAKPSADNSAIGSDFTGKMATPSPNAGDSGTGPDITSKRATPSAGNSGTGSDTTSKRAKPSAGNSGNGSDTTSKRVTPSADNSAIGSDFTGKMATPSPNAGNSGTGPDITSKRATPSAGNSGTGSDTTSKRPTPSAGNSGTGSDSTSKGATASADNPDIGSDTVSKGATASADNSVTGSDTTSKGATASNGNPVTASDTTSKRAKPSTEYPDIGLDRSFDVFINFRGRDSRHTVANVLYNRLTHAGFHVFLDDEEIWKGEVIEGELLRAITNSRIYIPIFSNDYASSKWCLRELAKMIDCWETSSTDTKKVILPIFYDVDVSDDVKLRSQVYTNALKKHCDELGEDAVEPWRDALRKVAGIKGWNLKDHGLSELVDLINEEVFSKLTTSEGVTALPNCLVGMDKPVEDIMQLLEEGSVGARFIVIHGMGGVGKTTLADAVFKKISSRFDGGCFLRDVRRVASIDGMVKLQERLLLDTLNLKSIHVSNIDDGMHKISNRLRSKNVLIVLDDVDRRDHLRNLAAESFWFGSKSRIMITTRNIEFLPMKDNGEHCFYEMEKLDGRHALQLFCCHAFEKERPPPELYDISTEIVHTTGGLPLSLQVIGSSLYNQDDDIWNFRLEKLKKAPHKDVQQALMISYEALECEQQQIFLDIACLFNDEGKTDPIYFWKACGFFPDSSIKILVRRSLVKVDDHDTLWMHDQLRDLGRAIVQRKLIGIESQIPAKASRLWSPECALDALQKKEVDQSVEALKLGRLDDACCFVREEFAGAINLRFLQLQGGNFEGDFKDVFQKLRWLNWFECPIIFKATNLSFKNLVVLKLSGSQITKKWGVFKEARHLKVLHLQFCECLNKTPEFSTFLELERLILRDCSELMEIDTSINKLKHLNYLEISNDNDNCENFFKIKAITKSSVPPSQPRLVQYSFGDLKSLRQLKIKNMGLTELHPSVGELVNLKLLYLRACSQINNLPSSIGKLKLLEVLDISFSSIKELPNSIGDLKQLSTLRMDHSAIKSLPDTIGELQSLEGLNLYYTGISQLPETIGNLKKLKVINVSSTPIKMLPKALVKLENLERLEAAFCLQLDGYLPEDIAKLSHLRNLFLFGTNINRVPTTINQLSHLHELNLEVIHDFQELLKLPTSLRDLTISSDSLGLHCMPGLANLTNLVRLVLRSGTRYDSQGSPLLGILDPDLYRLEDTFMFPVVKLDRLRDDLASMGSLAALLSRVGTSNSNISHWTWPLRAQRSQIPQMKWLAGLQKLEDLTLDLPDLVTPPTELSSLSRLQSLKMSCYDIQSLPHLPSNLERLRLSHVIWSKGGQLFSTTNNISTLALSGSWLREIDVAYLERLRSLLLYSCDFLKKLSNLSSLKELHNLEIIKCRYLVDIEGLGELNYLRSLKLKRCDSIRRLPNLWRSKKLEKLSFVMCDSLKSIPEVDEEAPCRLILLCCRHFRDFNGPYSGHHHAIKHRWLEETLSEDEQSSRSSREDVQC